MELVLKELVDRTIAAEFELNKARGEITLLRAHIAAMNAAFEKPFQVVLGEQQLHQIIQEMSKIVVAGLQNPKTQN